MKKLGLLFPILLMALSCQKKSTTSAATPTPQVTGPNGYDGEFYASAAGFDVLLYNNGQKCDGGTISANGISIPFSTITEYYYLYTQGSTGTTHWVVSGNPPNGVPAINYTTKTCPVVSSTSVTTISKSANFTLSYNNIIADSIIYKIHYKDCTFNDVLKKVTGSSASVIFTPSDLAPVCGTQAEVSVSAYNYDILIIGTKKYRLQSSTTSAATTVSVVP